MKKTLKGIFLLAASVVAMLMINMCVFAATPITVPTFNTGFEAAKTTIITYKSTDYVDGSYAGTIVPLVVSAPGTIQVSVNAVTLQKDTYIELFTDAACTNRVDSMSFYLGTTSKTEYMSVSYAGTYYLRFESGSSTYNPPNYTNSFSLGVAEFSNTVKTIKSGQTMRFWSDDSSDYRLFKYVATSTGMLTVTGNADNSSYVTLLDSSKKVISESRSLYSSSSYTGRFAVKKGKTYYLKIYSYCYSTPSAFKVSQKKITEKSGSKKKKAKTVKAKKTIKGTLINGTGEIDWYKFKVTKKKKVTITFKSYTDDFTYMEVFNSKGRSIGYCSNCQQVKKLQSVGKLSKGTYYIKIYKYNKIKGSVYDLKWK